MGLDHLTYMTIQLSGGQKCFSMLIFTKDICFTDVSTLEMISASLSFFKKNYVWIHFECQWIFLTSG